MRFFILVLLVACGAQLGGPDTRGQWCLDHTCNYADLTFTPDPGHEAVVESATDNLIERAGLELFLGPWGVPVHFQPEVWVDGESKCGVTIVGKANEEVISLDIFIATEHLEGCVPQWAVVRHEIGCHALHSNAAHTETGVCSPSSQGTAVIDEVSLAHIR